MSDDKTPATPEESTPEVVSDPVVPAEAETPAVETPAVEPPASEVPAASAAEAPAAPAAPTAPVPPNPYATSANPYAAAPAAPAVKQGLGLSSFITGLAGLLFFWFPGLGFLASLAAVILGFVGKKKEPQAPGWMWITGVITGFVGILLGLLAAFFLFVVPFLFLSTTVSELGNLGEVYID